MAKMDLAHRETDKLIEDLEKRIDETYARAARETQAKLDKYLKSFEKKDAEKKKLVDSKQMKQSEYEKWRIGQIMTGKRWEEMSKTLATDLAHADYIAQKITQDSMIDAYALNHNYATYEVEKGSMVDTSYTMYDHDTAERLIAKEPQLLPKASEKTEQKIREGKLIRWNQQKITSEVTQSILQGESVDKMARRMRNVTDMDRRASIRNARTSMTGAQNAGRQDGYERAQEMGIDTEKQWMAVMDDRTRHWHVELDGEHVPVDEPFHNEYGDIEYPGDPNADPANVYNCRCTMICRIKGFEKDFTDRTNEALGDMSYEDWKKMHAEKQAEHGYVREKQESTQDNGMNVVEGKNLLESWERRYNDFDFAINDILDAQGFDGLPKVVSEKEFNNYVKESSFIAQRTYSAPNQEVLNAYRDELYNGKWYVDCSTGGSKYGRGMYCAANYDGILTDSIKQEMIDYQDQNTMYSGLQSVNFIETFTIDKSAKIINYDDLVELKSTTMKTLQKEKVDSIPWKNRSEEEYIADLAKARKEVNVYYNMDEGEFAALMGYDGIRTNAGTSGADTIMLNRTKIIFKEE